MLFNLGIAAEAEVQLAKIVGACPVRPARALAVVNTGLQGGNATVAFALGHTTGLFAARSGVYRRQPLRRFSRAALTGPSRTAAL